MNISASFLSSKNIPRDLMRLNETDLDFIHVDVMDGKYVPNKTMPFKQMRNIYKYTSKRLDVHLMVKNPKKYIKDYATLNTEFITIHPNIDEDLITCFQEIKSYAVKVGLALNPNVEVKDIVPYLPYLDLILVMGVEPGKGGQSFIEETVEKLKEVQVLLKSYPEFSILVSIDGGINQETAALVYPYVDILVSGSYLIGQENLENAITSLRELKNKI